MKNSHKILGIVVPTNEPQVFKELFLRSIDNLKDIAEISTILLNFQSPWTTQEIDLVVEELESKGFEVKWKFSNYDIIDRKIPFNKIRNDAAMIMPDARYFLLVDDDAEFLPPSEGKESSGATILDTLYYMETHEKCGFSLFWCKYQAVPSNHIGVLRFGSPIWNRKALLFRSLYDICPDYPLFPSGSLELIGSGEEQLLAASRYYYGLYGAVVPSANINHIEAWGKTLESGDTLTNGDKAYGWSCNSIRKNNNDKFIVDNYCKNYTNRKHNLVGSSYYDHGGLPEDELPSNVEINPNNYNSRKAHMKEYLISMLDK